MKADRPWSARRSSGFSFDRIVVVWVSKRMSEGAGGADSCEQLDAGSKLLLKEHLQIVVQDDSNSQENHAEGRTWMARLACKRVPGDLQSRQFLTRLVSIRGATGMASEGSVSRWIDQLKTGESAAAQQLWERYFDRLVALARSQLRGKPRGPADEEDVALSALDSFCRGAAHGRFPQLVHRDSLWRLLVAITARKAFDVVRDEQRLKRGGGAVRAEAALADPDDSTIGPALEQVLSREPDPAFAVELAEECRRLLERLDSPELRTIALWKMEEYTNEEIAAKLGCVPRTVQRKLQLIRDTWMQERQP
jgi:DNA-directed RNA polymerase specialized sigma24 family protein